MKSMALFCMAALCCCHAYCQSYDNNWVFGDSVGLNFSTANPGSFVSGMIAREASASISDSAGNLQFYTNGQRVWNRNHELMPNGDGLRIGQVGDYGSSTTQGVMIIPKPGSQTLYYIFQLQYFLDSGMLYSKVDMSLSGGLGDVVEKNMRLYDRPITERLQAIKHANGRDWWLVIQAYDKTADSLLIFSTFLFTPEGFQGPFEQVSESHWTNSYGSGVGQMAFNRQGDKVLFPLDLHFEVYDFDRCTGLFSNRFPSADISNKGIYGAVLSPDGSKVYVAVAGGSQLYQYCLNCDDEPIDSSQTLVFQNPFGVNYCFAQLLLAPDDKIYFPLIWNELPSDVFSPVNQHLSTINYPNLPCPACYVDTLAVSLGERRDIANLPNMPNYNLGALVGSGCDTLTAIADMAPFSMQLYPNPAAHSVSIAMPAQPITIRLQTMLGTTLYTQQVATGHAVIPLQDFPPGMYIVSLEVNHIIMATQKLVIQR